MSSWLLLLPCGMVLAADEPKAMSEALAVVWPVVTDPLTYLVGLVVLGVVLAMMGQVPLSYNVFNLLVRWRTTVMTATAFVLVTALYVGMSAFVNGMVQLTEGSGVPENVMILSEGATDETFSNLGFSDVSDLETQAGIARLDDQPLFSKETFLSVNLPNPDPLPGRPKRRFLQVRGVDDPKIAAAVHNLRVLPGGEWFSDAGVREVPGANGEPESVVEVVLGEGIARLLGGDRNPATLPAGANPEQLQVGDVLTVDRRKWLIVGLMTSNGSTYDSELWAKQSLIGPLFGKRTYTTLVARATDTASAETLAAFLNKEYTKASLSAQLETKYFSTLSETNKQFLVAIQFVSAVMSLGGIFGVMNTMFAAVSQRVKDIGVLRMLGFKRWQVLSSFLLESLVLALVGGLVGCAIGCLAHGWSASSIISSGQGGGKSVVLRMAVDEASLISGLALSLGMGFVGGLIPALSAMRLKALDALR